MRILSLDQSVGITGYAVFEDCELETCGALQSPAVNKSSPIERFASMCKQIETLIDKYAPDQVVFEDVSMKASVKTLILLARLQGAIITYCLKRNIAYTIYVPTQWRKLVGIKQGYQVKRPVLKEQAIAFVNEKYGVKVGDDVAEGICIGYAFQLETEISPQK